MNDSLRLIFRQPVYLALRPMGRVTKSRPSIVVVLKVEDLSVPEILERAQYIVERMKGNSWFPSPSPPLAEVQATIDTLSAAEVRTLTRAPDSVPDRDAKRLVLMTRLDELRNYVFTIANRNPDHCAEIVESAGMYLKKLRGPSPQVWGAEPGSRSGEVDVTAPRVGDRAAYEFQYSLDDKKTWLPFPQAVYTKASATLRGLKPGSTVHLRYRVTVKGVTTDWSECDPISLIVN